MLDVALDGRDLRWTWSEIDVIWDERDLEWTWSGMDVIWDGRDLGWTWSGMDVIWDGRDAGREREAGWTWSWTDAKPDGCEAGQTCSWMDVKMLDVLMDKWQCWNDVTLDGYDTRRDAGWRRTEARRTCCCWTKRWNNDTGWMRCWTDVMLNRRDTEAGWIWSWKLDGEADEKRVMSYTCLT